MHKCVYNRSMILLHLNNEIMFRLCFDIFTSIYIMKNMILLYFRPRGKLGIQLKGTHAGGANSKTDSAIQQYLTSNTKPIIVYVWFFSFFSNQNPCIDLTGIAFVGESGRENPRWRRSAWKLEATSVRTTHLSEKPNPNPTVSSLFFVVLV